MTKFLLAVVLFAAGSAVVQSSVLDRDQIYARLVGEWTGQLEYRDFSSNERVVLPTWLEVKTTADGRSAQFTYTYDDGPTKTVTESSTVTIDPASHRFTITSDRDHSTDSYQIEDAVAASPGRRMQFVLKGTGKENDKPVDVRIVLSIDRNLYRFTKETRQSGQDFLFRDGYTFTRRDPGQSGR